MALSNLFSDLDSAADEFGPQAADRLLQWAIDHHATDVHAIPSRNGLAIAGRVAGVLEPVCTLESGGDRLVARLKVLAQLLTYRTDAPQEGRLVFGSSGLESDANSLNREVRLATCPTVLGEKAILRFFPQVDGLESIGDLGLPEHIQRPWDSLAAAPSGLLLISGPAGSGKTTTAYATVRAIRDRDESTRSIVSLEDPVEQLLDGVAQTAVAGTTGLTFASGLRAILRHDPEVILVGELRDRDTIDTAVRAALTGHLVIATMHAGSAAESVLRFFDAEVEPFLILSGLLGVLHQRLVTFEDGSRGPIAELLDMRSTDVRAAVREQRSADELDAIAQQSGMVTLEQAARELQAEGKIDGREFVKLIGTDASV